MILLPVSDGYKHMRDLLPFLMDNKHKEDEKWIKEFTEDKISKMIEIGFLLNNLYLDKIPNKIIFKYNEIDIELSISIDAMSHTPEEAIFSSFIADTLFNRAFDSFKREHKLNKLLN